MKLTRVLPSTLLLAALLLALGLQPAMAQEEGDAGEEATVVYPPNGNGNGNGNGAPEDENGEADVEGVQVEEAETEPAEVLRVTEELAVTGTDAMVLTGLGLLLVLLGVVAVRGLRKPSSREPR